MTNIHEKIEKLLRMAGDPATTEDEAVAFMEKAYDLMSKYNISPEGLAETSEAPVNEELYTPKVDASWYQKLAVATSTLYFSGVYRKKIVDKEHQRFTNEGLEFGKKTVYLFVGKKHNRSVAHGMFGYFMETMDRMAKEAYDSPKDRVEFHKGFCFRLQQRILEEIKKAKSNYNLPNRDNLPMVIENEAQAVALYIAERTNGKARRMKTKIASEAAIKGYEAADEVSFNKQLGEAYTEPKFLNTIGKYLIK